jgi:hypothetical protein
MRDLVRTGAIRSAARRACAIAALAGLVSSTGSATATTAAPPSHAALDRLLAAHVQGERVDYLALCGRDRAVLTRYLDTLAAADPARLAPNDRLAFEIDLYNATMLAAVCDRYREGWTPAADDFAVFKAPLVRRAGKAISLNALEHEIIRPTFQDPRVHVALVCAARSCPPLLPRAYRGADVDSLLDANMRRFLADTTRNRIDLRGRRLELSRLFDWYAADFGGAGEVPAFVAKWTGRPVVGWPVTFREYDWALNAVSPPASFGPAPGNKPLGEPRPRR